ncbi:hypothetical protein Bra5_CH00606 [Rhizobium phaseoli Brasil 5]|uniref:Uncharacterized protein n=1 Tax=Rhizobium etli (strain CIAT 652) TaxID=491916 RepID=B3PNQ4_RHIE6|nr:hypothetical protein RHECIAT_CH0000626 [Rhizobium etli CIAT 652]ARM10881.1 hypothetical protein Bra5_CH00606 [Rhizobium phaseoli Brasil 5]KKZ87670.1 hypothetical protein RPHASCH2410_CH09775 [Rhizobium phaseoli Ch24-10]
MMTAPAGRFPSRPRSNAHLTAKSLPEAFDQPLGRWRSRVDDSTDAPGDLSRIIRLFSDCVTGGGKNGECLGAAGLL